jgi:hypothetical protein
MITFAATESGFVASLNDMLRQLHEFPEKEMGPEMTDWQTEDMHRQYPYTLVHGKQVYTVIWPRGLSARQRQAVAERQERAMSSQRLGVRTLRKKKRKKYGRRITRKTYQTSKHRPILKEMLFDKLVTRMTALLEQIHWQ